MKILFVDHAFHQRTRSAEFFVEEVRKHGEVDIFYFDPDEHERHLKALNAKLQRESWDLVIVWQLEILALASIRLGLPTIICPMYDGSSTQPPEHWKVLWQSAAIQFSLQLSIATQRYQRRQMLVRYYPDPKSATPVEDFSRLNAFLWVRRSSEVVAEHAFLLLRGQVDTFHFHIALDDPNDSYILPDWLNAYPVTTSTWFESKVELQNVLDRCNVYICPRHTEGIGMAMLEAMNRGMAVLASSLPVHNEYVASRVNGLHFQPGNYSAVDLRGRAARLGHAARQSVVRGREAWESQMEQLGGFLHAVAREAPVPQYDIATTQQLILCYFRDMALYHGLARELPGPPEQTGESAQGLEPASNAVKTGGPQKSRIDGIRIAAQSVPLWRSVRGFIPLRVKQRVAAWLSRMEEHS